MSRLLTQVTRGRIRTGTTKKVLVLAVAGILYFAGEIVPPQIIVKKLEEQGIHFKDKEFDKALLEQLHREDEELLLIINAFLHASS